MSAENGTSAEPVPEGDITFRDRPMRVRMPQPEQILVWRRIMSRLEGANIRDWNGKEVMAALERIRTIIDSVLIDSEDVDWLDDEMLAGRLGLRDATDILLKATDAFSNRAGRRAAAKKTPPARRKAPAKATTAKKTTRKATS